MDISKIFENNRVWVKEKLAEDEDFFKRLAKGQKPEVLFIGCSDSRVNIGAIMGVKPGEV